MNLFPYGPFITIVLTFIVTTAFKTGKHLLVEGNSVYVYPKGAVYSFLVLSFLMLLAPWWAPLIGKKSTPFDDILLPYMIAAGAFLGFVWAQRYRVVLGRENITSGSFFHREIPYADVVRVQYLGTPAKGRYRLYTASGRKITVWSSIDGFASFLEEIRARLPKDVKMDRPERWRAYDKP